MKTLERLRAKQLVNQASHPKNKKYITKEKANSVFFKSITIRLLKIKQLFTSRIKPIKHKEQIKRDLLKQFLYGAVNILAGTLGIMLAPIGLIIHAIYAAATGQFKNKQAWRIFGIAALAVFPFVQLTQGIAQIGMGLLNVVFTPIRALITKIKGKPKIEDNRGLRMLAGIEFDKATRNNDVMTQRLIVEALYHKAAKNIRRGQKTAFLDVQEVFDNDVILNHKKTAPELREVILRNPEQHIAMFRDAISKRDQARAHAKNAAPDAVRAVSRRTAS